MIDRLILNNFARAQAFDRSLTEAAGIAKLAEQFTDSIMFEANAARRAAALARFQAALIAHAATEVLPQAQRIGAANAIDIARKIGKPIDVLSERERRLVLFQGTRRVEDRLAQIRLSVRGESAVLENRLLRYWLQPAEGTSQQKLDRLREIHKRLEARRKKFESELRAYHDKKIPKRPARPDLDYMSEMHLQVKSDLRVQARRAGTDAELQTFRERGHKLFAWVVPNGHSACPDCQVRAGAIATVEQWEHYGRPGSGMTVCESNCFCMLVPSETLSHAPGLAFTEPKVRVVLTTPEQLAFFRANRRR